jgi:hypothetical protein
LKSIDFSLSESKGKIFHDFFTNKYIIDIVSKYLNDKPLLTELNCIQEKEISDISWKTLQECKELTRPHYSQRLEMLKSLERIVNTFDT